MKKCGIIAIIGLPNAGKSTLLNQILGEKVSITCRKAQTTRVAIRGILTEGNAQLVFIDTPGLFNPHHQPDRTMMRQAWHAIHEADSILLVADAARANILALNEGLLNQLDRPVMLALNKVDLIEKRKLISLAQTFMATEKVTSVFMISAKTGDGVSDLKQSCLENLPVRPWAYEENQLTDASDRFTAEELVREQILQHLHDELPYAITIKTEKWEEREDGLLQILQIIYVPKPQYRGILLGKNGQTIKKIGMAARVGIEEILGRRVYLGLHIQVSHKKS